MNKKIIIACCDDCENRRWAEAELTKHLGYQTTYFCHIACMPLEHTNKIPDFCPLPDDTEGK